MNKKAELTTTQIIGMIILILGFAIVIVFFWKLNMSGRVDKETCHTSVILRGSLPSFGGAQEYVPLKCATEKVCITSGLFAGKCTDDYGNLKGVTYVKVDSKEKGLEQVQQYLAQSILECWTMMGEGKVSLYNQWLANTYGIGQVYPFCAICSRIAFDKKSLEDNKVDLSKMDLNKYMLTHFVPDKEITYYDFLVGKDAKVKISDTLNIQSDSSSSATTNTDSSVVTVSQLDNSQVEAEKAKQATDAALQYKSLAIMFSQISSPDQLGSLGNIGKTLLGASVSSFVLAPGATMQGAKYAGKACTSGGWVGPAICAATTILGIGVQQINVAYNRAVTAGYCGDVSVGTEARSGCSVVRTTHYDVSEIKNYCSVIESLP